MLSPTYQPVYLILLPSAEEVPACLRYSLPRPTLPTQRPERPSAREAQAKLHKPQFRIATCQGTPVP